jgi:hypothetical protein
MGMSRVFSWDLLSARWDSLVDVPVTQCRKEIASRCAPVRGSYSAVVRGFGQATLVTPMDWPEVLHVDSAGELREILRLREEGRGGFSLLLVEDEERIWVGYVGEQEWLAIEPGVRRLARVKFPARFSLRDHVALGVLSDSLGVQQVATLGVLGS